MGKEEYNVQKETIKVKLEDLAKSTVSTPHIKKQIRCKKKVPAEAFSALLTDLKLTYNT